jgi:hypothetical protein
MTVKGHDEHPQSEAGASSAARAVYAAPELTELSVRATQGGTVPDRFESQEFAPVVGGGDSVFGADPDPSVI